MAIKCNMKGKNAHHFILFSISCSTTYGFAGASPTSANTNKNNTNNHNNNSSERAAADLEVTLRRIDGKSYGAYKDIQGITVKPKNKRKNKINENTKKKKEKKNLICHIVRYLLFSRIFFVHRSCPI